MYGILVLWITAGFWRIISIYFYEPRIKKFAGNIFSPTILFGKPHFWFLWQKHTKTSNLWQIFVLEIGKPEAAGWHKVECRLLPCYARNELLTATSEPICCTAHFWSFVLKMAHDAKCSRSELNSGYSINTIHETNLFNVTIIWWRAGSFTWALHAAISKRSHFLYASGRNYC
jgi:hypothetical protein